VPARYKVWVVLGSERLELLIAYSTVKEGEEKMARKVLGLVVVLGLFSLSRILFHLSGFQKLGTFP